MNNFIFTTIFLCILLIGIDVAFFYLRQKKYTDGKTLTFTLQEILRQIMEWLGRQMPGRQPNSLQTPPSSDPSLSAAQQTSPTPVEESASTVQSFPADAALAENSSPAQPDIAPALTLETAPNDKFAASETSHANIAAQPAMASPTVSMTTSSLPVATVSPENENAGNTVSAAGNKTVHIQVSADIPEGTIVHVTLEVVDKQGKSSFQRSFAREVMQESAVLPASESRQAQQLPLKREFNQTHLAHQNRIAVITKQFVSTIRHGLGLVSQAISQNYKVENLDRILLVAAIAIYALVISLGIDRYPIYFFTDEAIHMNLAANFLRDGYKNYFGEFLPTFFTSEGWVNGTSVYVQVLPFILFGKSVVVTRLVSAAISLLGALAIGLLLRDAFKLKYYWAGIFMVLTTPAWFLHARTAFEYVEVGSFYSIFLYFYSRYRAGHLRSFYWAIIAGALAFYTHGLGQILMGVTGLALFSIDFRYHTHSDRRKTVLNGILLGTILLLPFARYYLAHPGEAVAQVKRRGSYWMDGNLTFLEKSGEFFKQYFYGLNPAYWYLKNQVDLNRHIMNGYGDGLWYTFPLLAVGLFQAIKNIRLPSFRIVLIALLVCPIPASVVAIGMPRMLWMSIPVALLSTIGLSTVLDWVETRRHIRPAWIAAGLFIMLAGLSIFMLRDALVNGPTWVKDYSLYGMQYGAKQVFQDVVRTGLEKNPNRRYVVTPNWANGTEQFVAFFIPTEYQSRVSMGQPVDFVETLKQNPPDLYFVSTSDEYDKLLASPEFQDIKVDQVLLYPDGRPGFYVITLKVSENIDQILAAKQLAERQPVEDTMTLNGQTMQVIHSPMGSGRLEDVFDNNPDSLARVMRANPFIFDIYPTTPVDTQSVNIQTGSLPDFTMTISLYAPGVSMPVTYSQTFKGLPPDPSVSMTFDKGPAKSERIYIEIKDNTSGDKSQIHVRTIQFK